MYNFLLFIFLLWKYLKLRRTKNVTFILQVVQHSLVELSDLCGVYLCPQLLLALELCLSVCLSTCVCLSVVRSVVRCQAALVPLSLAAVRRTRTYDQSLFNMLL